MVRAIAYEIEICRCGAVRLVCCYCCCWMVVGRSWGKWGCAGAEACLCPGWREQQQGHCCLFRCCTGPVGDDALDEAVDGGDGFVA